MGEASTSFDPDIFSVKTKWLREDCSFIWVLPTDLVQCGEKKFRLTVDM
jgi:5'(3')-deoxyribonucleotidase